MRSSGYNSTHKCHLSRALGWILMRSSRRWVRAEWARSIALVTPPLKRDVAIKVLPVYWSRDPESLRRFELEAQATAALNHPNIVSIFHVGKYERSPYIVTELLQGETLRDRLRKGPMRLRNVLDTGMELAARARGRARRRDRSSRPQAGKHLRNERRTDQDLRLWAGEARSSEGRNRRRFDHSLSAGIRRQDRCRYSGLHVARAGARTSRGCAQRYLRRRR